MKLNLSRQILVAFGASLILLIGISIVSYQSVSELLETRGKVARTREVMAEVDDALSAVKDAETGQRGFLLTGDESFLDPYNSATPTIEGRIKDLQLIMSESPAQQQRLPVSSSRWHHDTTARWPRFGPGHSLGIG